MCYCCWLTPTDSSGQKAQADELRKSEVSAERIGLIPLSHHYGSNRRKPRIYREDREGTVKPQSKHEPSATFCKTTTAFRRQTIFLEPRLEPYKYIIFVCVYDCAALVA